MELQEQQETNIADIKAVYLAAEDLKIAASILYLAYYDDPLFVDIFQYDKEGYESRLRSAIREELNAFWAARQPMRCARTLKFGTRPFRLRCGPI